MTRAAPNPSAALCSVEGCSRPWSSNFGRRLCPVHAQNPPAQALPRRPVPVPTHEPSGWWTELDQTSPHETGPDA